MRSLTAGSSKSHTSTPKPLKELILFTLARDFLLNSDEEDIIFFTGQRTEGIAGKELNIPTINHLIKQLNKVGPDHVKRLYEKIQHIDSQKKLFFETILKTASSYQTLTTLRNIHGNKAIAALLEAENYENINSAFVSFCKFGQLESLNNLISQVGEPLLKKHMTQKLYNNAFASASASGHLYIINWLVEFATNEVGGMLTSGGFSPYRVACQNGHLEILNRLVELVKKEDTISIKNMIEYLHYESFTSATQQGHLHILKRLVALVDNEESLNVKNMLESRDHVIFSIAINNGHTDIFKWLMTEAAKYKVEVKNILAANTYDLFASCLNKHDLETAMYVMQLAHNNTCLTAMLNATTSKRDYKKNYAIVQHYLNLTQPKQIQKFQLNSDE